MNRITHLSGYGRLIVLALLGFLAAFAVSYVTIDTFRNAYLNLNQAYLAGAMVLPLLMLELWLMGPGAYPNKRMNAVILSACIILFAVLVFCLRQQVAVTEDELLRSMITHHGGALHMCEKASVEDAQVRELCANIFKGKQAEIDWMKLKLESLAR